MSKSLRYGREQVAIPGPSVIPDRVLAAMNRAMPNIYEGELIDTSHSVLADLPAVARTEGASFVTISNGHGAWEMALTNTLSKGDKVLVLESGRFATAWGHIASIAGIDVQVVRGPDRGPIDMQGLEDALRADTGHAIKAILVVQVDTASSVLNDVAAIRKVIDGTGHPALFMVDCIASLACERYEMDAWGVDVTVAGAQKGLMVPPGLGFVWASDKAMAAHKNADLRTGYWDWSLRLGDGPHYRVYCGTPPIQHIYALREALDMLNEEGMENVWWRHEVMAEAVWAAVDAWSDSGKIECNIPDVEYRSHAVTTVRTAVADELRARARDEAGLIIGLPLGGFEGAAFRIGHMGHLNPPMMLGTLGTIEATLASLDVVSARSGVGAAAAVMAPHLAGYA